MAALTEWLQIMLAEIARKRDEQERARQEEVKRTDEHMPARVRPERRAQH